MTDRPQLETQPDSPIPQATADSTRRFRTLLLLILFGVATQLRWSCSQDGLWLDEVWTWDISHKLTWWGGLFYQLREENNHYLNTLMVWLFRDCGWVWYRVPAVVCGVLTVAIAWRLGRVDSKFGTLAGGVAAGLTATSYLLVHYSSEARGYSYVVFFAALAFLQLQVLEICRQLGSILSVRAARIQRMSRVLFPLACCCGFLSQPVFLTCFGAMVVWVYLRVNRPGTQEQVKPTILRYFLVPGLFFVLLYLVDLRFAVNGGGDEFPLWRVVIETLSLTGGGPFAGWTAFVVAGLVAGAFVHGLRVQSQNGDDRWIFQLLIVVVMPLGLLVVLRRAEVYPRYFLIAVFFLIQAASVGLADLLRRGLAGWIFATVSLAAVMWGNGQHIGRLVNLGRGSYLPVLQSLADQEDSLVIQLRSDHDFRHPLMLRYSTQFADLHGKTLEHVGREKVPAGGTEWLLTHSLDVQWQPPQSRTVQGIEYDLRLFRPYAGLSGWGLALYQRRTSRESSPEPAL